MALILSIETATQACSVALHNAGKLVAYQTLCIAKSHAESLFLMVAHLFDISPYSKKDLAAIAVSEGPGSYTGLRIGISTAKGLGYALDIPLIAINTLEAMVYGVGCYNFEKALLCPMIDARRMEVYCLVSDAAGEILAGPHTQIVDSNSFQPWLQQKRMLFFGDGVEKCKPSLSNHQHAIFLEKIYPSAQHIGALAYTKFQQQAFRDLAALVPLYLKPFQSQANYP